VRSHVDLVATTDRAGRTRLTRCAAHGQLAVRQTGPNRVHLVGAAAGPLGGDTVVVTVLVGDRARLELRGVAATLAQPDRLGRLGRIQLRAEVGPDASLDLALPPTVVTAGARLSVSTALHTDPAGRLRVLERVVLGRHGEPPGRWTGRTTLDSGRPVLRHTLRSELLAGPDGDRAEVRAVATLLIRDPEPAAGGPGSGAAGTGVVGTRGGAVAMSLAAGGVLVTALGTSLPMVEHDLGAALLELDPSAALGWPGTG
jgi:urease accessory protein